MRFTPTLRSSGTRRKRRASEFERCTATEFIDTRKEKHMAKGSRSRKNQKLLDGVKLAVEAASC